MTLSLLPVGAFATDSTSPTVTVYTDGSVVTEPAGSGNEVVLYLAKTSAKIVQPALEELIVAGATKEAVEVDAAAESVSDLSTSEATKYMYKFASLDPQLLTSEYANLTLYAVEYATEEAEEEQDPAVIVAGFTKLDLKKELNIGLLNLTPEYAADAAAGKATIKNAEFADADNNDVYYKNLTDWTQGKTAYAQFVEEYANYSANLGLTAITGADVAAISGTDGLALSLENNSYVAVFEYSDDELVGFGITGLVTVAPEIDLTLATFTSNSVTLTSQAPAEGDADITLPASAIQTGESTLSAVPVTYAAAQDATLKTVSAELTITGDVEEVYYSAPTTAAGDTAPTSIATGYTKVDSGSDVYAIPEQDYTTNNTLLVAVKTTEEFENAIYFYEFTLTKTAAGSALLKSVTATDSSAYDTSSQANPSTDAAKPTELNQYAVKVGALAGKEDIAFTLSVADTVTYAAAKLSTDTSAWSNEAVAGETDSKTASVTVNMNRASANQKVSLRLTSVTGEPDATTTYAYYELPVVFTTGSAAATPLTAITAGSEGTAAAVQLVTDDTKQVQLSLTASTNPESPTAVALAMTAEEVERTTGVTLTFAPKAGYTLTGQIATEAGTPTADTYTGAVTVDGTSGVLTVGSSSSLDMSGNNVLYLKVTPTNGGVDTYYAIKVTKTADAEVNLTSAEWNAIVGTVGTATDVIHTAAVEDDPATTDVNEEADAQTVSVTPITFASTAETVTNASVELKFDDFNLGGYYAVAVGVDAGAETTATKSVLKATVSQAAANASESAIQAQQNGVTLTLSGLTLTSGGTYLKVWAEDGTAVKYFLLKTESQGIVTLGDTAKADPYTIMLSTGDPAEFTIPVNAGSKTFAESVDASMFTLGGLEDVLDATADDYSFTATRTSSTVVTLTVSGTVKNTAAVAKALTLSIKGNAFTDGSADETVYAASTVSAASYTLQVADNPLTLLKGAAVPADTTAAVVTVKSGGASASVKFANEDNVATAANYALALTVPTSGTAALTDYETPNSVTTENDVKATLTLAGTAANAEVAKQDLTVTVKKEAFDTAKSSNEDTLFFANDATAKKTDDAGVTVQVVDVGADKQVTFLKGVENSVDVTITLPSTITLTSGAASANYTVTNTYNNAAGKTVTATPKEGSNSEGGHALVLTLSGTAANISDTEALHNLVVGIPAAALSNSAAMDVKVPFVIGDATVGTTNIGLIAAQAGHEFTVNVTLSAGMEFADPADTEEDKYTAEQLAYITVKAGDKDSSADSNTPFTVKNFTVSGQTGTITLTTTADNAAAAAADITVEIDPRLLKNNDGYAVASVEAKAATEHDAQLTVGSVAQTQIANKTAQVGKTTLGDVTLKLTSTNLTFNKTLLENEGTDLMSLFSLAVTGNTEVPGSLEIASAVVSETNVANDTVTLTLALADGVDKVDSEWLAGHNGNYKEVTGTDAQSAYKLKANIISDVFEQTTVLPANTAEGAAEGAKLYAVGIDGTATELWILPEHQITVTLPATTTKAGADYKVAFSGIYGANGAELAAGGYTFVFTTSKPGATEGSDPDTAEFTVTDSLTATTAGSLGTGSKGTDGGVNIGNQLTDTAVNTLELTSVYLTSDPNQANLIDGAKVNYVIDDTAATEEQLEDGAVRITVSNAAVGQIVLTDAGAKAITATTESNEETRNPIAVTKLHDVEALRVYFKTSGGTANTTPVDGETLTLTQIDEATGWKLFNGTTDITTGGIVYTIYNTQDAADASENQATENQLIVEGDLTSGCYVEITGLKVALDANTQAITSALKFVYAEDTETVATWNTASTLVIPVDQSAATLTLMNTADTPVATTEAKSTDALTLSIDADSFKDYKGDAITSGDVKVYVFSDKEVDGTTYVADGENTTRTSPNGITAPDTTSTTYVATLDATVNTETDNTDPDNPVTTTTITATILDGTFWKASTAARTLAYVVTYTADDETWTVATVTATGADELTVTAGAAANIAFCSDANGAAATASSNAITASTETGYFKDANDGNKAKMLAVTSTNYVLVTDAYGNPVQGASVTADASSTSTTLKVSGTQVEVAAEATAATATTSDKGVATFNSTNLFVLNTATETKNDLKIKFSVSGATDTIESAAFTLMPSNLSENLVRLTFDNTTEKTVLAGEKIKFAITNARNSSGDAYGEDAEVVVNYTIKDETAETQVKAAADVTAKINVTAEDGKSYFELDTDAISELHTAGKYTIVINKVDALTDEGHFEYTAAKTPYIPFEVKGGAPAKITVKNGPASTDLASGATIGDFTVEIDDQYDHPATYDGSIEVTVSAFDGAELTGTKTVNVASGATGTFSGLKITELAGKTHNGEELSFKATYGSGTDEKSLTGKLQINLAASQSYADVALTYASGELKIGLSGVYDTTGLPVTGSKDVVVTYTDEGDQETTYTVQNVTFSGDAENGGSAETITLTAAADNSPVPTKEGTYTVTVAIQNVDVYKYANNKNTIDVRTVNLPTEPVQKDGKYATTATLADHSANPATAVELTTYTVEAGTYNSGTKTVPLTLTAAKVPNHKNANGTLSHWVGVAIPVLDKTGVTTTYSWNAGDYDKEAADAANAGSMKWQDAPRTTEDGYNTFYFDTTDWNNENGCYVAVKYTENDNEVIFVYDITCNVTAETSATLSTAKLQDNGDLLVTLTHVLDSKGQTMANGDVTDKATVTLTPAGADPIEIKDQTIVVEDGGATITVSATDLVNKVVGGATVTVSGGLESITSAEAVTVAAANNYRFAYKSNVTLTSSATAKLYTIVNNTLGAETARLEKSGDAFTLAVSGAELNADTTYALKVVDNGRTYLTVVTIEADKYAYTDIDLTGWENGKLLIGSPVKVETGAKNGTNYNFTVSGLLAGRNYVIQVTDPDTEASAIIAWDGSYGDYHGVNKAGSEVLVAETAGTVQYNDYAAICNYAELASGGNCVSQKFTVAATN